MSSGPTQRPWLRAKPIVPFSLAESACVQIPDRLSSVGTRQCMELNLRPCGAVFFEERSLLVANFAVRRTPTPHARVLIVGGTHGHRFSSVSVIFKWMPLLHSGRTGPFEWKVTPLLNPGGLLSKPSTRINANGIDLNRNFPTQNWEEESQRYWI
jgi:protein MpaA